jgi:predicted nucleic acid-binding Zn ribbon protein
VKTRRPPGKRNPGPRRTGSDRPQTGRSDAGRPGAESSTPVALSAAISDAIAGLGLEVRLEEYTVLDRWADIVGDGIAAQTKAERIKDGKLWVSVRQSTWRNELMFMKETLIESVNKAFGKQIITDIVLR